LILVALHLILLLSALDDVEADEDDEDEDGDHHDWS